MTISLLDAITNVKKDAHWLKKTFIVGIIVVLYAIIPAVCFSVKLSALSVILLTSLCIVSAIYFWGFYFKTTNNYLNTDDNQMAELGEKNLLVLGLKIVLSYIGYGIVLTFIAALFIIIAILICALFIGLIYLIAREQTLVKTLGIIFSSGIYILVLAYTMILVQTMFAYYATDLTINRMFAFKKHLQIIKENHHQCWTLFGKYILFLILAGLVSISVSATIIGILLLPALIVYINCVYGNMLAQFGKTIDIKKYC